MENKTILAIVVSIILIIVIIVLLVLVFIPKSSYEPSMYYGEEFDDLNRPKQFAEIGKWQRDTLPPLFNITKTGASIVTDWNTPGQGISEGIANTALSQQLSALNLKKFGEDRKLVRPPISDDTYRFYGNYSDPVLNNPFIKQVLPNSNYGTSDFTRNTVEENLTKK